MSNQKVLVYNFFWKFAERLGAQFVSLFVSILLARMLTPETYGTIALITVFISIMQVFVDSGLGNALIQKKNSDELDFSTVFYTNIVLCVILYIFIFGVAPYIASFYGDLVLMDYIRVLGITVLISGLRNVQHAYIAKKFLFKKFFLSTIIATILSGVIGIFLAYNEFGVWALVFQQVSNALISTVILWITVEWRPELRQGRKFSLHRLNQLYQFGWKILVSSLIDIIYNNSRQLIIGKLYTPSNLAQYNRGRQFPDLIIQNINSSIDSVLLPAVSKEQDNIVRVRELTRKAIMLSTFIIAPMMIGLIFVAEPLVRLILTEKWLPSVLYMRIFCITYMFYPIHTANLNAIKALGRSDIFLKLEIMKKIIGFLILFLSMWNGILIMAYSLIIVSLINQFINSYPNKKLLLYSYSQQIRDIIPSIIIALLMGICIYPVKYLAFSDGIILLLQIIIGSIVYVFLAIVCRIEIFAYLINMIKSSFKKEF